MTIRITEDQAIAAGLVSPKKFGRPSKFKNKRVEVDGIQFQSQREAARYGVLKMLRQAGHVDWFIMQTPFRMPGGIKYVADFLVVWADGRVTVEDAKGVRTQVYVNKKKQVEELYGVKIIEV